MNLSGIWYDLDTDEVKYRAADGTITVLDIGGGGGAHPDLATHDALGLATDAELADFVPIPASPETINDTSGATLGQLETTVNDVKQALRDIGLLAGGGAFDPESVGGLVNWYHADDLSALADNDPIPTWAERTGSGSSFGSLTGSGAARPTYKTAILNGLAVARFAGAQVMTATNGGSPVSVNQPCTSLLVARVNPVPASGFQAFVDSSTDDRHLIYADGSNYKLYCNGGPVSGGSTVTTFKILVTVANAGSSKLWVSGGAAATGTVGSTGYFGLKMGDQAAGGHALVGDIQQLLVYSGALSLANINYLGAGLAAETGLTWTTAT